MTKKSLKIKNPEFCPNEIRKKAANQFVKYPDYPQHADVPNLLLPSDVSLALKMLEAGLFGQIDEFYPMAMKEIFTQTQYAILANGVKNSENLFMNKQIWPNVSTGLTPSYSNKFLLINCGSRYFS